MKGTTPKEKICLLLIVGLLIYGIYYGFESKKSAEVQSQADALIKEICAINGIVKFAIEGEEYVCEDINEQ